MAWSEETRAMVNALSDDEKRIFDHLYSRNSKDLTIAVCLSILFGFTGIDRFYAGDLITGLLKFLLSASALTLKLLDYFLNNAPMESAIRKWIRNFLVEAPIVRFLPITKISLAFIVAAVFWWIADIFLIKFAINRRNEAKVPELAAQARMLHQAGFDIPQIQPKPVLLTVLAIVAFLLVLIAVCIALYKAVSSTPATMP